MRRLIALLVVVLVTGAACDSADDPATPEARSTSSPGSFTTARALIDTGDDSVLLTVEVADDDEERARGLMGRGSLPEDHGMVFIYFEEHAGGFWMKDTLIPLSIAFFDRRGEILSILDMDPCEADPCDIYNPGVSYAGALEVNQGMFDEWDVQEGDSITISQ